MNDSQFERFMILLDQDSRRVIDVVGCEEHKEAWFAHCDMRDQLKMLAMHLFIHQGDHANNPKVMDRLLMDFPQGHEIIKLPQVEEPRGEVHPQIPILVDGLLQKTRDSQVEWSSSGVFGRYATDVVDYRVCLNYSPIPEGDSYTVEVWGGRYLITVARPTIGSKLAEKCEVLLRHIELGFGQELERAVKALLG